MTVERCLLAPGRMESGALVLSGAAELPFWAGTTGRHSEGN